ncbi:alpha-1,2-fucosyltransferase [Microbacterium lacus]|uniref:alpha-1,2-fucosyltransferase n=1 Tax=Microbacterium lacus TaxID=415217 RepID=UPI00384E7B45
MTPRVGLRLGNLLYVWLRAHSRTAAGSPTLALSAPAMTPWLVDFPALKALTVDKGGLRFSDRREWDGEYLYQRFGLDFQRNELANFIHAALVSHVIPLADDTLVINVRRGDYYTDHRAKYEFDQAGYIGAALDHVGEASEIRVVSDDPAWCREQLGGLFRDRIARVIYDDANPLENLLTVAGASRIIGANSTFSYWGAYIADVVHEHTIVVMPRFHGRMGAGRTDAHQLDPRWVAIEGFS